MTKFYGSYHTEGAEEEQGVWDRGDLPLCFNRLDTEGQLMPDAGKLEAWGDKAAQLMLC